MNFHAFDLALKVLKLGPLIVILIALGDSLLTETTSFEVLFVEHALSTGKLIVEVQILLSPTKKRNGHGTEPWSLSILRNS